MSSPGRFPASPAFLAAALFAFAVPAVASFAQPSKMQHEHGKRFAAYMQLGEYENALKEWEQIRIDSQSPSWLVINLPDAVFAYEHVGNSAHALACIQFLRELKDAKGPRPPSDMSQAIARSRLERIVKVMKDVRVKSAASKLITELPRHRMVIERPKA